jgi:glucokinase
MPLTVGLDLGGTKILAVLLDPDGGVRAEERVETPDGAAAVLTALAAATRSVDRAGEASAVGVGAAGLVDGAGVLRYAPNIRSLVEFPLGPALADALGMPVVVDNDANAAAWGEAVHGAARGVADALVVTLGTGVGGGIIAGGRLYRGAHGFAAEIGHFQVVEGGPECACGERGHWEALASGSALGRIGRAWAVRGDLPSAVVLAGGDPSLVTGEHVGTAAVAGERDALAVLAEYADGVAVGLAALVNILDPALIVIGGGLVGLGDALLDPVRSALARRVEAPDHRPPVTIAPAALGERAGAVGAAAYAREALTRG